MDVQMYSTVEKSRAYPDVCIKSRKHCMYGIECI